MTTQKTPNPWINGSKQRKAVWQKGYDAFSAGESHLRNPYSIDRVQFGCCGRGHWAMIWFDGWSTAKSDAEVGQEPKRPKTITVCANDVLSKVGWRPDMFPPKDSQ